MPGTNKKEHLKACSPTTYRIEVGGVLNGLAELHLPILAVENIGENNGCGKNSQKGGDA